MFIKNVVIIAVWLVATLSMSMANKLYEKNDNTVNSVLDTQYGYVKIYNDSQTNVITINQAEGNVFGGIDQGLDNGYVDIDPGKSIKLRYAVDWGLHVQGQAQAGAVCKATGSGEFKWILWFSSKARGSFRTQAECEASISMSFDGETGLFKSLNIPFSISASDGYCKTNQDIASGYAYYTTSVVKFSPNVIHTADRFKDAVKGIVPETDKASELISCDVGSNFKFDLKNTTPTPSYLMSPTTTIHLNTDITHVNSYGYNN